jgi:hypothetical protein
MPKQDSQGNWVLTEDERRRDAAIGRDRSRYDKQTLAPKATPEEIEADKIRIAERSSAR